MAGANGYFALRAALRLFARAWRDKKWRELRHEVSRPLPSGRDMLETALPANIDSNAGYIPGKLMCASQFFEDRAAAAGAFLLLGNESALGALTGRLAVGKALALAA